MVKVVYLLWSPLAIKFAIVTTIPILNIKKKIISLSLVTLRKEKGDAFDYGSNFVNPRHVLGPDLTHDAEPMVYKVFLFSSGYSEELLYLITKDNNTCDQSFYSCTRKVHVFDCGSGL